MIDNKKPQDIAENQDLLVKGKNELITTPTGKTTHSLYRILNAGSTIKELPNRQKKINPHITISVKETNEKIEKVTVKQHKDKDAKTIERSLKKLEVTETKSDSNYKIIISIGNFNESLTKTNKSTKKIYITLLQKLAYKKYDNNLSNDIELSITTDELVAMGMFKNSDTARVGLKAAAEVLNDIKIAGTVDYWEKGKKQKGTLRKDKLELTGIQIFKTGIVRGTGTMVVFLDQNINYEYLLPYLTVLPNYYQSLPETQADLLFYIYELARQRLEEIRKNGFFTMSLRTVHAYLGLVDESNKNPKKLIKDKIYGCIEELNQMDDRENFFITVDGVNKNDPIGYWLDNGKLTIHISGGTKKYFTDYAEKKKEIIDAKEKQKSIRTEKAKTLALAKSMEKSE